MAEAWLVENRNRLIAWQKTEYSRPANGEIRLNVGGGHIKYPGYINVDPFTAEADVKADARVLPYEAGTVDEISSHHSLEHMPQRDFEATLREWVRVLRPGGLLDLGMPDLELCIDAFKDMPEAQKWNWGIYTLFGWQLDPEGGTNAPIDEGQFHRSGVTRARLCELLTGLDMEILECYNYDGYDTPSVWVLARKAEPTTVSALEQDCVMGTFTNKTDYLPTLLDSVKRHLPHIPMLVKVQDAPIALNMEALRKDFLTSGRRYWVFLDDDICFLNRRIIHDAIRDLVKYKFAAVNVYSDFNPDCLTRPYAETLRQLPVPAVRQIGWATGYFILVDSWIVGQVKPDLNLPDLNTAIDTSYSMGILQAGGTIGLSGSVVYHLYKNTPANQAVIGPTNAYLMQKYGSFYFDHCKYENNVLGWPERK